jgi:exopolyphosphatase/guanosine-5'-triphosphate,3'-diphosphate pyrophosphatase
LHLDSLCEPRYALGDLIIISEISRSEEILLKRYATIDIGSNTILLLIGRVSVQGVFEVVFDGGETTRLGRGLQKGKKLDPVSVQKSIEVLKRFVSLCYGEGVTEIACVGTNALRTAADADQFIHQVQKECGIIPRVIDETEEAMLSYISVQQDPLMPPDAVVMDVGGGSTEYIFHRKEGSADQLCTISLSLGAVDLTEKFLLADPPSHKEVQNLRKEIGKTLYGIPSPLGGALVGIGGTAVTLGSMHLGLDAFDREKIHGLLLTINELRAQVKELEDRNLTARKEIKGLSPDRADIILAGAILILYSMERLKKDTLNISSHGLRYGLFYQEFIGAE